MKRRKKKGKKKGKKNELFCNLMENKLNIPKCEENLKIKRKIIDNIPRIVFAHPGRILLNVWQYCTKIP